MFIAIHDISDQYYIDSSIEEAASGLAEITGDPIENFRIFKLGEEYSAKLTITTTFTKVS